MIIIYLTKHFIESIFLFCYSVYLFFYKPIAIGFIKIGLPIVTELQASIVLEEYCRISLYPSEFYDIVRMDVVVLGSALEKWYGGKFF